MPKGFPLRLEALHPPAVGGTAVLAAVEQAVVQPVLAPLPELYLFGHDPVAPPKGRARDLASLVLGLQPPQPLLQSLPVSDGAALRAGPRPEPATPRTAPVVRVRLPL